MTCKVEIVSGLTCPESLSQEVIDYYLNNTNYSKEQVEKLYEGFKKQLKLYNERLRGQNRLLCLGLDIDRPKYEYSTNYLAGWKTPYDLFIATTEEYNGYDTESMFFDFGPKWYLEMKIRRFRSRSVRRNQPAAAYVMEQGGRVLFHWYQQNGDYAG